MEPHFLATWVHVPNAPKLEMGKICDPSHQETTCPCLWHVSLPWEAFYMDDGGLTKVRLRFGGVLLKV